jgi:hypothetical protein
MSEAISMHKRMAMYGQDEATHLKKGGKVAKFAKGGAVGAYPERGVTNLPAKGVKPKIEKPVPHAIATMKKGGGAKKHGVGLTVIMAMPVKRGAGRGR